jgi:peptidoglycan L-alanyl-D-glutamate endopeptidase CwlK
MSRSLDDLRPEIRPMVDKFLAAVQAAGIDLLVTCTLRSFAEQTALYAQGRTAPGYIVTKAKAGESAHNFGLAVDVVPIVNGKPEWVGSDPIWEQVGEMGEQAGLEWYGAVGQPFPELPHFQHREWRLIAQQLEA